jgi:guanylate kinase
MLIFICGEGGSGKDMVANAVLKDFPDIERVVLYTTREMRKTETDGKDYHFISMTEFFYMKSHNEFIETREYRTANGVLYYGTRRMDLNKTYLIWGSLEMLNTLKKAIPNEIKSIYLESRPITRIQRMLKRGTEDEQVVESCRRVYSDYLDYKSCDKGDFDSVINVDRFSRSQSIKAVKQVVSEYIRNGT